MNKITIIGDPHCKPSNLDKIEVLFDMVEDLGNTSVWLGDMLDTKELVRSSCLNTLYRKLSESKLEHYILVGNHDWFNLECKDHSLVPLRELINVHIVQSPVVTELGLMVPYIHDHNEFKKVMKSHVGKTNVAFVHQGFSGFDYGNGFIAENESDISYIKGYDLVISGHFHKYQKGGNLIYLGTPFSHSFGESNQTKYVGSLNLDTLKLTKYETPFPKHLTVEVDCDKTANLVEDKDNYVRIILNGSQESIDRFDKTNHLNNTKFIEKPSSFLNDMIVDETESNEVKFKKWAEAQGIETDTIEIGLTLMKG